MRMKVSSRMTNTWAMRHDLLAARGLVTYGGKAIQTMKTVGIDKVQFDPGTWYSQYDRKSNTVKGRSFCFSSLFPVQRRAEVIKWVKQGGGIMVNDKDRRDANFIIECHAQNDLPHEALYLFYVMLSTDIRPNAITMIVVLSACSQTALLSLGRSLHRYIEKSLAIDGLNLQNSLVEMYGKCGCMNSARKVVDMIGTRDVFSWTSMMGAYAKCGNLDTVRQVFDEMHERNVVTSSSMIAAYSQTDRPRRCPELVP